MGEISELGELLLRGGSDEDAVLFVAYEGERAAANGMDKEQCPYPAGKVREVWLSEWKTEMRLRAYREGLHAGMFGMLQLHCPFRDVDQAIAWRNGRDDGLGAMKVEQVA